MAPSHHPDKYVHFIQLGEWDASPFMTGEVCIVPCWGRVSFLAVDAAICVFIWRSKRYWTHCMRYVTEGRVQLFDYFCKNRVDVKVKVNARSWFVL